MAVENQTSEQFANNRHVLYWDNIYDKGGSTVLDLNGKIVKFVLQTLSNGIPLKDNPILSFSSDDVSSQVVIVNDQPPVSTVESERHVTVEIKAADCEALADAGDTDYGVQLEVFSAGDTTPVIVATGTHTIKRNVAE